MVSPSWTEQRTIPVAMGEEQAHTGRLGGVLVAAVETLPVGGELEDDAVVDVLFSAGLPAQVVG